MPFDVSLGGATLKVEVRALGGGRFCVTVDGTELELEPQVVPGGLLLRFGDRVLDLVVGGDDPSAPFLAAGAYRARASLETDRQRMSRERRKRLGDHGGKVVESPMHGRVVKLLVAVGDDVAAGQPVAVVEAMKMENEIRARGGGRVREIPVKPGDAVVVKTPLVLFE